MEKEKMFWLPRLSLQPFRAFVRGGCINGGSTRGVKLVSPTRTHVITFNINKPWHPLARRWSAWRVFKDESLARARGSYTSCALPNMFCARTLIVIIILFKYQEKNCGKLSPATYDDMEGQIWPAGLEFDTYLHNPPHQYMERWFHI